MDPVTLGTLALLLLLALLILRVPIGFVLSTVAIIGMFIIFAWPEGRAFNPDRAVRPLTAFLGTDPFSFTKTYSFTMVPMFIALGHLAHRARFTTDMFYAIRILLPNLPGGLAIASIIGCGGFSSISGSSVACASAMGRIAVPEMLKYGYSKPLATASVAAGGTLGSLIPPSLVLVIYGIFTEQSIGMLFIAGILPGLISMLGYVLAILFWVGRYPDAAPSNFQPATRQEKWEAAMRIWPIVTISIIVVGGIYSGFLTANESAAIAVVAAVIMGFMTKRLTMNLFINAIVETAFQTSVIFVIAIGAKLLVTFVGMTGIANNLVEWTIGQDYSAMYVLFLVCLLYLILGTFLDAVGILLLTLPLTIPIIEALGFNLIWFGIIVVKLIEVGLMTPPVGMNVFVIKSVVGKEIGLVDIFKGTTVFVISDLIVLGLLIAFPIIALLLPQAMY
ncbi:C4-dicarboxylate ABC transporter permease [Oceanicola sp. 22II-s10i]|uniref:TRAP transporter large permease n=1 Tax=Oceanicola sp. 22II-s10i TaxID=1317116 RepID=UPI000B526330|nr:TRAP transporter large permease subunit [Oceanicola sp. 22II-s10i]OWU83032.1 C4-dicarboxylate ABC transporter permease [Oceanicola sp. 22II-s10i]